MRPALPTRRRDMRSHIRRHVGIGTVDYRLAGDALSVAGEPLRRQTVVRPAREEDNRLLRVADFKRVAVRLDAAIRLDGDKSIELHVEPL